MPRAADIQAEGLKRKAPAKLVRSTGAKSCMCRFALLEGADIGAECSAGVKQKPRPVGSTGAKVALNTVRGSLYPHAPNSI
jgi:hypothetical protein